MKSATGPPDLEALESLTQLLEERLAKLERKAVIDPNRVRRIVARVFIAKLGESGWSKYAPDVNDIIEKTLHGGIGSSLHACLDDIKTLIITNQEEDDNGAQCRCA